MHQKKRLTEKLGDNIYVSTAPPLLLCGLDREESIRDIFDLQEWICGAVPDELLFKSANYEALCAIIENGQGGAQPEYRSRVRLPTSMAGGKAQKIWCTGANASLPRETGPTTEEREKTVMAAIMERSRPSLPSTWTSRPSQAGSLRCQLPKDRATSWLWEAAMQKDW